jgi:arsenate reductase
MRARGLDLSAARPQKLTDAVAAGAGWLITMGCGDECPIVPGVRRDDWPLLDPKGQSLETVKAIAGDIDRRVRTFVTTHGWQKSEVRT